jgi:putative phosphoesterase
MAYMKQIGLISDSHGFIPEKLFSFFESVDEIWHAGDFGSVEIADRLATFKPLRGVFGNIDGRQIREIYPQNLRFWCEQVDVWMTHIGGYPGKYDRRVQNEIALHPPKLFICGHSHILKVIYDDKLEMLYMNPGAVGLYGFHKKITALRFIIDGSEIRNLQLWEIDKIDLKEKSS